MNKNKLAIIWPLAYFSCMGSNSFWLSTVFRPCKWELYVSIAVVVFGTASVLHLPHSFRDYLVFNGCLVAGLFCAINALIDYRRMKLFELLICYPWAVLLTGATGFFLFQATQVQIFADR